MKIMKKRFRNGFRILCEIWAKAICWFDCHARVTLSLPKQRFFILFTLWPFKIAGVQWQPVWNIHHPYCSFSSVPEYMGAEMEKKLTVHFWKVCSLPRVPDETSPSMCLLQINQHSYFTAQNLYKITKAYSKISGNNKEKYRKLFWIPETKEKWTSSIIDTIYKFQCQTGQ